MYTDTQSYDFVINLFSTTKYLVKIEIHLMMRLYLQFVKKRNTNPTKGIYIPEIEKKEEKS